MKKNKIEMKCEKCGKPQQKMQTSPIRIGTCSILSRAVSAAASMQCISTDRRLADMGNRKINILGTEYRIETHKVSEDSYLEKNKLAGYCGEESKLIVIADMSEEKYFSGMDEKEQEVYRKRTLRHEIMHAFLNESGLSDSSNQYGGAWAKNEEMVDWFAIQSPKIFKVYTELDIL